MPFRRDGREGGVGHHGRDGGLPAGTRDVRAFAAYWPTATEDGEFADLMSSMPKFVASTTLDEPNLVDEYRLMIHPVVVGSGKRLFREGKSRIPLELVDSEVTPRIERGGARLGKGGETTCES
jgi:hypothetical protein